ncbi:MAG: hypothetical protein AAFV87_13030, partial [Pseudomonadota bacterium]
MVGFETRTGSSGGGI